MNIKFKAPGETKTLDFDIKNEGTIDAILLGVNGTINNDGKLTCEPEDEAGQTICGTNGKNDGAVTYQITYDNEDITSEGFGTPGLDESKKKLSASEGTKHVKITVKYDGTGITSDTLPTKEVTITLPTISFEYGQDDSVE